MAEISAIPAARAGLFSTVPGIDQHLGNQIEDAGGGFLDWYATRVNVGDQVAVSISVPRARPVSKIGGKALAVANVISIQDGCANVGIRLVIPCVHAAHRLLVKSEVSPSDHILVRIGMGLGDGMYSISFWILFSGMRYPSVPVSEGYSLLSHIAKMAARLAGVPIAGASASH